MLGCDVSACPPLTVTAKFTIELALHTRTLTPQTIVNTDLCFFYAHDWMKRRQKPFFAAAQISRWNILVAATTD